MLSQKIEDIIKGVVKLENNAVVQVKEEDLESEVMDKLVWEAVFGEETDKRSARWLIWEIGQLVGVRPASIHELYMAVGRGEVSKRFSVPAINVRGMAYDMGRALFGVARKMRVGALITEIARSEMGYTSQSPEEYVTVMMGSALREGWRGALFVQGDHFQAKAKSFGIPKEGEIESIKELVLKAIKAGFYNIDIDMSTLVDLEKEDEREQQKANIKYSLEIAKWVRRHEPERITVSLGGEIGHIGGKNSTVADFEAYMDGFLAGLPEGMERMSKVSVQTGTSHGGVVLADGSLAEVDVDFSVLRKITKVAREKYQMGGTVQHGASTLPDKYFAEFPKADAIEVHLATGFQNLIFDHSSFPKDLLREMYDWLDENKQTERKEGWSDEQFHYKLRKKVWGVFKKQVWELEARVREEIREVLSQRFEFLYDALGVVDTQGVVAEIIKSKIQRKKLEEFLGE